MRFGEGVTRQEMERARALERFGITTFSQAVKAFQRKDEEKIKAWERALKAKQIERGLN